MPPPGAPVAPASPMTTPAADELASAVHCRYRPLPIAPILPSSPTHCMGATMGATVVQLTLQAESAHLDTLADCVLSKTQDALTYVFGATITLRATGIRRGVRQGGGDGGTRQVG
jgi:hypothetical protein